MTIDWRAELCPFAGLAHMQQGRTRLDFLSPYERMWLAEMNPFEFERMARETVPDTITCENGEPIDEGKF